MLGDFTDPDVVLWQIVAARLRHKPATGEGTRELNERHVRIYVKELSTRLAT